MDPNLSEPLRNEPPRTEVSRNPYAPPSSRLDGPAAVASGGSDGVSTLSLDYLRQTRPWVKLISVMVFIGAALMLIIALLAIGGGSLMQGITGDSGVPVAALGVLYLAIAFLYIAPAVYLWRYGKAIGALADSRRVRDLEEALGHQKSFWRFVGICTAVVLVLYAVALVFVIGAAILASVAS